MVPKIYQNTCTISGMKIGAKNGTSLIDICHIVPLSKTQDDRVNNGITLCPNLHRGFDSGFLSNDKNYRVLVSEHVVEDQAHSYGLAILRRRRIILPSEKYQWSNPENLKCHREIQF